MSKPTVSAAGEAMPAEGQKTRRMALAILAGASALAAAPAAALLAGHVAPLVVDPVFSAIERHEASVAAFNATEEDTPSEAAASNMESDALADFLETVPTSVLGFRAALEHTAKVDCGYYLKDIVDTLLKSPLLAA